VIFAPLFKTISAASGSFQILNSAAAVEFLTSCPPPMITISSMLSTNEGSARRTIAMFVRGPTGTIVTFSGLFLIVFMYHVTKFSSTGFNTGSGRLNFLGW